MVVIVSRRYRRHRYHKTKPQNPRKTSKTDKALDKEMMELLESIGKFGNFGNVRNENPNAVGRALDWICEKVDCALCGSFMVEMSKDACCQRCFEMWVFLDDGRKCPFCGVPLKDMLNRRQVDKLCSLVKLKTKKLTDAGHFTEDLVRYRAEEINMNIPN
ncbi:uncharacterized protein LOC113554554 [Rhopalosiphum maidis]|uniref:uncharacterized protein LOC113554554 n=1 Tax=Rhopalosiphum maidis TaxID=43146 RepID=UPI000EFE78C8|nr:uncharacterized protein LOC113554554 [Rhopalosiphum maidis]XP_026814247.1 uncharacterized protein LOC113554554 [Rhopalosiphum maidis]